MQSNTASNLPKNICHIWNADVYSVNQSEELLPAKRNYQKGYLPKEETVQTLIRRGPVNLRSFLLSTGGGISMLGFLLFGIFLGTGSLLIMALAFTISGIALMIASLVVKKGVASNESPVEAVNPINEFIAWARSNYEFNDISDHILETLYITDSVTFLHGGVPVCFLLSVDDYSGERFIFELQSVSPGSPSSPLGTTLESLKCKCSEAADIKSKGSNPVEEVEAFSPSLTSEFIATETLELDDISQMSEEAMSEEAMSEEAMSEEAMSEEAMSEEAMSEEAMSEEAMSVKTNPAKTTRRKRGRKALTVQDLRGQAKALGVKSYSRMNKDELKKAIRTVKRHNLNKQGVDSP